MIFRIFPLVNLVICKWNIECLKIYEFIILYVLHISLKLHLEMYHDVDEVLINVFIGLMTSTDLDQNHILSGFYFGSGINIS